MTLEKAKEVRYMIDKEMCRHSLADICENWEISIEEYDEFMNGAMIYFENLEKDDDHSNQ